MYRIEGNGSYRNTFIWKDGQKISYKKCIFRINIAECVAEVDGISGTLDRMIISAVYLIISDGNFNNSRILFHDEMLRGIQSIIGKIDNEGHPMLRVDAILLPNIIEAPFAEESK